MIAQLSPLLSRVSTQVRPEDMLLQKGAWVYFSPSWPGTFAWARGRLFEVIEEPLLVRYAASYILPGSDYRDVDLSNVTAGLKLYPDDEGVLYECAVGLKPGSYLMHIYIPKGKYVFALRDPNMFPDVTDSDKRYLGAKMPSDSPHTSPLLFLYFIKDAPAVSLRLYVTEDVSYDKVPIEFQVNKCRLVEIPATADQIKRAKRIAYHEELLGF